MVLAIRHAFPSRTSLALDQPLLSSPCPVVVVVSRQSSFSHLILAGPLSRPAGALIIDPNFAIHDLPRISVFISTRTPLRRRHSLAESPLHRQNSTPTAYEKLSAGSVFWFIPRCQSAAAAVFRSFRQHSWACEFLTVSCCGGCLSQRLTASYSPSPPKKASKSAALAHLPPTNTQSVSPRLTQLSLSATTIFGTIPYC